MRIAHVTDFYLPRVGGIERQVHDLAARQREQGHEVEVITATTGPPGPIGSVATVRPPWRAGSEPGALRYQWARAGRSVAVGGDYDLVHVHGSIWSPLAFAAAGGAAKAGIPTVYTVHSLWSYATPLYRVGARIVRCRDLPVAWSAVSSIAAAPMRRALRRGAEVTILPNGVEPTPSDAAPLRPSRPERIVVACVGRLAPRKRPLHLLRMLARARDRVPGEIVIEAVLAGDGPQRSALERFVAKEGMGDWVRMIGAVDHDRIHDVYRDADFYIAPARLESFGIAALEARFAGLPVVAYQRSGIADFITHDVEGLLVDDDDAMTDAIVRLATSPRTLARLRQHNAHHEPAITWATVLERTDVLYERAAHLAGRSPRRLSGVAPPR